LDRKRKQKNDSKNAAGLNKRHPYKTVWSNYRPAGRMWPATAFSVARGSIQDKSSNLKFVEKRVRLHLSHWLAYAG